MKLFNFVFTILIFTIFSGVVYWQITGLSSTKQQPVSPKNSYFYKFEDAVNKAGLKPLNVNLTGFNDQIEFFLNWENKNGSTKIIASTGKDPYRQISTLQQVLKIAKIKNTYVQFIDLSIDQPYATFQNY